MCRRCGCLEAREGRALRAAPIQGALEAAVLVACAEAPRYGYEIAAWLAAEGLVTGTVSPGRLYETLAALDRAGAVAATSEPSDKGPSRRRYHLTETGKQRLHAWVVSLERSGVVLARLLARATAFEANSDETPVAEPAGIDQHEGGEIMPCQCNCGSRHAAHAETPDAAPAAPAVPARSVEERLDTIESLLETLATR
ncbi:MAG: PadR family transcriptional regulator [Actinomycetota bacterium]|nr:PadR family transcriptional regulator [Actinomycetota bacterium]